MKAILRIGALSLLLATFGCRDVSTDAQPGNAAGGSPQFDVATSATSVFHFVANSDFGQVFWSTGSLFGSAFVSKGGSVTNPQAFLEYFVFRFNPCCSFAEGFGPIAVGDLTGSGAGKLMLNTNTCTDPGFFTFGSACGVVSIEWDKTSFFTGRSEGTSSNTFADFTFRSIGTSEFSSAAATGSIVGFPIGSPNFAEMGMNHFVTIDILRP